MATAKQVFEALPHVNEVWVTEDGNHHLHSANGGEKFERVSNESVDDEVSVNAEAESIKRESEEAELNKIKEADADKSKNNANKK